MSETLVTCIEIIEKKLLREFFLFFFKSFRPCLDHFVESANSLLQMLIFAKEIITWRVTAV